MTQLNSQTNNEKPIGVLKIKPKGKKFIVTFDEEELELTEELMVSYRVSLDKRYTEKEFKDLKKDVKISKSLDKTIYFISFKPRSEKEVYDYLKKEKHNDNDINKILSKLKSNSFIDDEEYVKTLMNDFYIKLKGTYALKYELQQKGISDKLIIDAINKFNEELMIDDLVNKYQKEELKLTNLPILKQQQKLKESLIRRGFSNNTISEVIKRIEFNEDLNDQLMKDIDKICAKTNDYNKRITYLLSKGYNYNLIKEHLKK